MKKLFNQRKKPYEEEALNEWDEDLGASEEEDAEQEDAEFGSDAYEDIEDWDTYYTAEDRESFYEDAGEAYCADEDEEPEDSEEGYYADGDGESEESGEIYYADEDEEPEETGEIYYADEDGEPEDLEEGYYADGDGESEEIGEIYYADEDGEPEDSEEGYYADGDEEAEEIGEIYYADEDEETEASEEAYYADDEDLEDIEAEEDGAGTRAVRKKAGGRRAGGNLFFRLWNGFLEMGVMDRVIAATGVAVLVLVLVTGGVFVSARILDKQVSDFAGVGKQLEGINLIGESGLLAVADAEMGRIAAANAVLEEHLSQEPEKKDYEEEEFVKEVTVALNMTSIQKDLKIKFVNKKTGKLVANVPFQVSVTNPDGKTSTWSDDDMDGIIYEKGITPGNYKVSMNALEGEKYKDYTLASGEQKVEVKKDIDYKKVDVRNEIKKESQINAAKEDTKKNQTQVESALTDTVNWVESTSTANTFTEVPKSMVPDPTTLALAARFYRTAYTASVNPSGKNATVGERFTVTAVCDGAVLSGVSWTSSNPAVATVDANGNVTAVGVGTALISYTASVSSSDAISTAGASCSVTVAENLGTGTVTVDNAGPVLVVGGKTTLKASAANFTGGKELVYAIASSRGDIATAAVDGAGNVTVTGVAAGDAVLTITVNYKDGGTAATQASVNVNVKVTANKGISLDKTAATVYIGTPVTINAAIANAVTDTAVTAETSDGNIATTAVNGRAVTITGVNPGSATITVRYNENGEQVSAACTVTVKSNPREDRTTKLKDTSGRQLYVNDNNQYREAVHADYYNFDKFFIKGDIKYTGWQTLDGKVYFFDAAGNRVTGEQVIQGAKYSFASDGTLVTGSGTMGIDVSKWNGTIDWNAVKNSGVSYAIIRCGYRGSSQGSLIEDPKYLNNIKGATAAGLKVGVYFFSQAVDEVEAVEEASMVLDLVKNYKISYPVFLDVESSGGRGDRIDADTRTAVCRAFCKTIQDAGYTAGVYSNKSWLTSKLDTQSLSAYKIWLAQYAAAPSYKGRYDLWQYRSNGKVSGISGNVDLNLSYLGY